MSLEKEILEKIYKLAYQNAFNDKETNNFIDLVNSGTSIDKAIEIIEKVNLPNENKKLAYQPDHHKANIDEFKAAREEGINLFAEWDTAGFDVCDICEEFAMKDNGYGKGIYKIEDIEGLIPACDNCRCVAIPANVGEEREDRLKEKDGENT